MMLKYSTYQSIYNGTLEATTPERNSVSHHMYPSGKSAKAVVTRSYPFSSMQNLFKIAIVLLLVISGFTVVGQVFASSGSSSQQEKRVVVEPGDTLWSIAIKNKPSDMRTVVYIEAIKRNNDLNSPDIQAGSVLSVPVYK